MNVQNEALKRFVRVLVKKGLYKEGEKIIINDEKEEQTLTDKLQEVAKNFIYKGVKVKVWTNIENNSYGVHVCDIRIGVAK